MTVIGDMELPIYQADTWDSDAAEQRVRNWATPTGSDQFDPDRYERAFFYRIAGEPRENVGSYKLGFADVIDGELRAVDRGIFAVANALQGARSPLQIPAEDREEIMGRVERYYRRIGEDTDQPELVAPWERDMTASISRATPDASWYDNPGLVMPTPITINRDTGRVVGHAALWKTPHRGYPIHTAPTPPRSGTNYSNFHLGSVLTADGSILPVGQLIMDTTHAPLGVNISDAQAHYAHTGLSAATARVGEDEYGIWVSGVLNAEIDDVQRARLMRSPLSGDWRPTDSGREMIALLAVNVPGFPVPHTPESIEYAPTLVADGASSREGALIAYGPPPATATIDRVVLRQKLLGVRGRQYGM